MKTLISRGANVNLCFDGGRNTLTCAAYQGHVEIVKELLKADVDTTIKYNCRIAHDLADQPGNSDIFVLLKE